jgi:hypothetical protein
MVDWHRRGELDQVVIHPRVEEVQASKSDMGARSEANTMFGHPRPYKADRDAQKFPYLARQLSVSREQGSKQSDE